MKKKKGAGSKGDGGRVGGLREAPCVSKNEAKPKVKETRRRRPERDGDFSSVAALLAELHGSKSHSL